MLELKAVSKHFGGVRAVDDLTLSIPKRQIFGLIGPNGSGKSTTVNLITGVFPVTAGQITLEGRDVTGARPHTLVSAGIARTFQNIRLFGDLTVWENLWVAQNSSEHRQSTGFLKRWLGGSAAAKSEVLPLLEFAGLGHKAYELARNLAFGEQRRLELARALAARPRLLLLDEPAAGMNSAEIGELAGRIRKLRDDGVTVLLIEHVMELVMNVTDRIAVLNFGRMIAEGTPVEIRANEAVRQAYLGAG